MNMGLIQAGTGALSGVLADQWREDFYCESLSVEVLVTKGQKRVNEKRSSNTKASDNIISNGSIVAVNDGQFMLIVEQGKIVEFCGEPGEFVYDTSSEPSLLYGGFGQGLIESFKMLARRFTFGGDTAKDQRVYYVNTKEIIGNKYGTANPVPFRVVDERASIYMDIGIRCFGEYSYRIVDPLLFYGNVCANVQNEYRRSELDSQLKTELLTALQPALAKVSGKGILYSQLPAHTTDIADALNEELSAKWGEARGIKIASFGVSSVSANEEDELLIKRMQQAASLKDPALGAGYTTAAAAAAMQDAAKNENGAFMGFAGMNMANQVGGANLSNLYGIAAQQQQQAASANTWTCSCGQINSGNFCSACGAKKPSSGGWTCSCGTVNTGKFCTECGKPSPKAVTCPNCGYTVSDPSQTPKFCPECGTKLS